MTKDEAVYLEEAADLARSLGINFNTSGAASEPGLNLEKTDDGSPWSLCRRPWVADVFHRQWPRVAMLHRAFFAEWL